MKRFYKITFCIFILYLFLGCIKNTYAQTDKVEEAVKTLQSGNVQEAVQQIDAAIKDPVLGKEYRTWYTRGFIYKEYGKKKTGDEAMKAYVEAFNSHKKSIQLDTKKENYKEDSVNISSLAKRFNNFASNNRLLSPPESTLALLRALSGENKKSSK